jgi:hypothetical protein
MAMEGHGHHTPPIAAPLSTPLARATVVVVFGIPVAAAWSWWDTREQRALLALTPAARREIYTHSIEDMRALCSTPTSAEAFAAHYEQKAGYLAEFPECDEECRPLVERYLPKPTR